MPPPDAAEPADHTPPDQPPKSQSTSKATNRRTGRRNPAAATKTDQPRWWELAPPQTVAMSPEQYQQAVAAWAVLIASWWTRNPPDHQPDTDHT